MATKNEKVSAYLPEHINEVFKAYKNDNNLKTDSQAIISIIVQFLSIESSVKTTGITLNEFQNLKFEITDLKQSYERYNFILSKPISNLLSELPKIVEKFSNFIDEFGSLKDRLEKLECQNNERPNEQNVSQLNTENLAKTDREKAINNNKTVLKVKELAKRLQVHETRVYRHRKTEKFTEWTRQKDPQGIGWLVLESGEFVPEDRILSIESAIESELPSKLSHLTATNSVLEDKVEKGVVEENLSPTLESPFSSGLPATPSSSTPSLTGYQLARRLGVKKDVPAGRKKNISRDEFYKWSKEKDIDRIGWIPNATEPKGYVPKDELPGELLSKLQKWIEQDNPTDSEFKAATTKPRTKRTSINRLLDDTADSLQGELLKT